MWRRWLLGGAVALGAGSGVACARSAFTPTEQDALDRADRVEILALDPYASPEERPEGATEEFHGHWILGRAPITDAAERKALFDAVSQGIQDSDGTAAKCFNPRHGLRIQSGPRTLDLSICFECLQIQVHDGAQQRTVLTAASPEPRLDAALARHGLKKR